MSDASTRHDIAAPARRPGPPRWRMARAIGALTLREMSTTHGRTSLGYLWTLAEPITGIILLTFVFSLLFRSPALGDNFQLFYATGVLPFGLWNELSSKVARSLRFAQALLAYPGVTYLDAIIARALLAAMTQVMVAYIVFGAIMVIYDLDPIVRWEYVILSMGLAMLFGLGVGTFNAYMNLRFPSYGNLYGIVTRPLFIISAIFFIFESVPAPYDDVLWFNPLVHITGMMRRGFYVTYDAEWISAGYVIGLSMILIMTGLALLRRDATGLLER